MGVTVIGTSVQLEIERDTENNRIIGLMIEYNLINGQETPICSVSLQSPTQITDLYPPFVQTRSKPVFSFYPSNNAMIDLFSSRTITPNTKPVLLSIKKNKESSLEVMIGTITET